MATKRKIDLESETALKAVEDALNFDLSIDDEAEQDATAYAELERSLEAAARDLAQENTSGTEDVAAASATSLPTSGSNQTEATQNSFENDQIVAANDDRKNAVNDLVYGLQKKPSSASLWVAALFSLIWLTIVGYYVNSIEPNYFNGVLSSQEIFSFSKTYIYLAAAILPIFLIFGTAIMIRRAQEMRFAAQSMTEAAVRLMQPEDIATDSLASVGRAIRREVSSINNSFEQTLARAGDLELMVQNEVLNLERSYADSEIKITGLVSDLSAEREMVIGHATKVRESIASAHIGLSDEMDSLQSKLQASINEAGNSITSQLNQAGLSATQSLENTSTQLVSMLTATSSEFDQKLNLSSSQFQSLFAQHTDKITDQINITGSNVASLMETQTASLREQGDVVTRQMEDSLSMRMSDFTSRIAETGEALQGMLDSRLSSLDGTLSIKGDAFVEALGTRTEALDKVLSNKTDVISQTLAERLSEFGQSMTDHVDSVVEQLKSRHTSLEQTTSQINETINERSDKLVEALKVKNAELSDTYISGETNIRNAMVSGLTELIGKAEDIRLQIDGQNLQLMDGMDSKASNMVAELDDRIRQLTGSVEDNATVLKHLMDEKTNIIFEGINARTSDLLTGMESKSVSFASDLEEKVSGVTGTIDQSTNKLLEGVEAGRQSVEVAMDQKASEMASVIEAGKEGLSNTVDNKYGLFSKLLEEKRDIISTDLDERIASTVGMIDEKASAISTILSERAEAINASLGKGVTENQRVLEAKSAEFNEILASRTSELEEIINSKALPLVDAIKNEGDIVSVKLGAVHETISSEVGGLLSKLGSASETLGQLVIRSSDELSAMENSISAQAALMKETVEKASDEVKLSTQIANQSTQNLDATSSNLMANIGNIAEKFDQHGAILQQATAILDNAQNNFSATLEDKSSAIDALAQGLAQRSSEIELSMAAFSQMLTKTMDDATQRTRTVNSTLGEEIKTAMDDTNARFAAASEAMRAAAQDVQRDLEDTRTQMRRGVMELPEETKQSADAMRKVVADQIAALRDLSEIVTRSGKAIDASPALSKPAQFASAPRQAPMQSSVQSPAQPLQSSFTPAQPVAPAVPRPAPVTAPPRQASANPTQATPTQAATSGWVSDLLRRASVDETPAPTQPVKDNRSPLHMVESLNSLSMDIARQIDHEASIELWDRYQRGERNVFTRRLYTIQGQQTFEEIRVKYSREQEFRNAVDRYIADFERLLEEVAKSDRDNMMVQTYLTSDTGKVYTMLAHASGRLGNQ